ncbi:hypothetical protein PMZ80_000151 [Knufia obscura]|uniref:Uncharacterized protein n=2 Tax=Knufia TaxID=430999 RepID=A0AAN8EMD2_9EURO|nr:hypothetical protein PMZ80_000151 [Knufia obscura]KAK5956920.1 hypothetical protein OHC33_002409 [Knufia fluminis]
MAPSRGTHPPISHTTSTPSDEKALTQQSNSALANAKRNFTYLISPTSTTTSTRPTRLRTRALLRTLRYISQFILWRLVRWAKYAAVGALVAGIGATAFGSVITGAAWIAAPPTIGVSVMASVIWGVGKFAARRLHRRWEREGGDVGHERREMEEMEGSSVRREGAYGVDVGPRVMPW